MGCNPERNKITTDDEEKVEEEEEAEEEELSQEEISKRYYVNFFAYNTMSVYYLWISAISEAMESWTMKDEPIAKVKEIRYKEDGKDVDRWTQMTDDYEEFTSSVDGISETYGYDCTLYYTDASYSSICAVITYVYPDSPAANAGIKRGDTVLKINGKTMTTSSYVSQVNNEMFGSTSVSLTMSDGTVHNLTAVKMYEDPVLLYKTINVEGRKVGYLHYTSFTLKSCDRLVEACKFFREEGVEELIIDLRYNGGGYVFTQKVLASMLAPKENVIAGDVLETEVYNELLTKEFASTSSTYLSFEHSIESDGTTYSYNTESANIGLKKIYAILSSGSASASESLLTCLMPYIPITIVGQQSHGKFCTGIMYGAEDWYEDYKNYLSSQVYKRGKTYAANWGLYVMIGRFADKNGNTPCMPDGFTPDYTVKDNPLSPYQLGDENEPMLAATLDVIKSGSASARSSKRIAARDSLSPAEFQHRGTAFGKNILLPSQLSR